uniref:J domain-containing protein n=1 Tax=Panagrolaimus davidi TaxID=227884 RepID=A0A914Q9B9_9BILA
MSSAISKRCLEAFQTDDLYTIIGITAEEKDDLTDAKLKKAYHRKSMEWHPDRHADKHPEERVVATRKFQVVADAYRILGDPKMKAIYDAEGLVDDDNFVGSNDEVVNGQEEVPLYYIIEADGYELRQRISGTTAILVFDFKDPSKCYHFHHHGKGVYYCTKCQREKHNCNASVGEKSNGEQYIKMKNDHVCEPIDYYDDETVTITNFEEYKSENGQELFIFDGDDRTNFYQYYYLKTKNCYICSRCQNNGGKMTQAIINPKTGELEVETFHQCEPQPYIPKIREPNFLMSKTKRGNPQIVVFADKSKKNCYKFRWHKRSGFLCVKCSITGRILKQSKGKKFFQLYKQHKCDPVPYKSS